MAIRYSFKFLYEIIGQGWQCLSHKAFQLIPIDSKPHLCAYQGEVNLCSIQVITPN